MAITGKFTGDFGSFLDAVNKANIALVDLGKTTVPVEKSLNRMVDNFSGRKLIQEASLMTIAVEKAGGVANLTGKELEVVGNKSAEAAAKMKALGYEVPAGLQKLADETKELSKQTASATTNVQGLFDAAKGLAGLLGIGIGVSTVINFAKEIFNAADALTKLHDKTGIGIVSLQVLGEIADESGNSLEDVTNAVSKMQIKLAGGDKSAVKALEELGISFSILKTLRPDQQFIEIGSAIAKLEDPAQQARAAFELFGKAGAEILPTLKANIADIASQTHTMSDDVVKRLDDTGDRWHRFWTNLKADAGNTFDYLFAGWARADELAKKAAQAGQIHPPGAPSTGTLLATTDPFAIQDALDRSNPISKQIAAANDAIKAQAEMKRAAAEAAKELNEEVKAMAAFEEEGVRAARSITLGPQTVLRDLGVAMGDIQQASRPTVGAIALMGDTSGYAAQHMAKLREETATFSSSVKSLFAGNFLKGFQDLGTSLKNAVDPVKVVSGALGNLVSGGISSLLNLGVSAIGGLFGKLFNDPEKQINPIRQGFVDMAGGIDALNQKAAAAGTTLTAMLNAKNPEQYKKAIDDLNAAFALSDQATKAADDTVTKFGLTIDQLGPKFKQQKLDEQAAGLVNDYKLLDAVAADHAITLEKLAPSVNAYIATILKAGGTVPEELKDPIKQMRELGLLTDASGEKFTDAQLDGLTFAKTLDEKFTTLLGGIQKLVDILTQKLGPAIDNLPSEHTIHIGYQVDNYPDIPGGAIAAASGYEGTVNRPTLFLAGEGGAAEHVSIGPSGGGGSGGGGAWQSLAAEIRGLREDMPRFFRDAVLLMG